MDAPYPGFGEPLEGNIGESHRSKAKKRRWQSRSDEEIAENLDSRGLRYRAGWPQLPPLPVFENRSGARDKVNDPEDIIRTVQVLCSAQRIVPIEIYFAFRAPEVQREGETYLTLVITTDLDQNPILYSLLIQIRKLLQQDPRHEEIAIEIIDHRVVHGLFTFAIPPSEKHLTDIWQSAFDIILEVIQDFEEPWMSVEMLYRGVVDSPARCPATIVITSPTAAADIWIESILPACRKRINHLSRLNIELLCGSSTSITSRRALPDIQTYQSTVAMGSSIGQKELEVHSGTAGGMVTLSDGKKYALTNHHVIRNEVLDNLLTQKSSSGEEFPFLVPRHPALKPDQHGFTCPSNEDHKAFVENRERYEKQWLDQVKNPAAAQHLTTTRTELQTARSADRSFASVYASSGLRSVRCEKFSSKNSDGSLAAETGKSQFRFMLDWALLEFHPKRSMANFLPMRQQNMSGSYGTLLSGQECSKWTVMNNPKCHISRDEVNVGKFGRTTEFTYGTINAIPTVINPETEGGQYKFFSDVYRLTVKDCGHSLSFVAHKDAAVGQGDSGSIVLHAPSGDWLGLLFGETRSKAALFTPIDLIFRDIEKVTGQKVLEPTFSSTW